MKTTEIASFIYIAICVISYFLVGFELILIIMLAIITIKLMEINVRLKVIGGKRKVDNDDF